METVMKEAKSYKKGDFIIINDVPCKVVDVIVSKPGRHGAAKAKIIATGLFDGKKRELLKPGDARVPAPIIDKRTGQVLVVKDNALEVMDLETYEVFDVMPNEDIKEEIKEGINIEYWIIAGTIKIAMRVRND